MFICYSTTVHAHCKYIIIIYASYGYRFHRSMFSILEFLHFGVHKVVRLAFIFMSRPVSDQVNWKIGHEKLLQTSSPSLNSLLTDVFIPVRSFVLFCVSKHFYQVRRRSFLGLTWKWNEFFSSPTTITNCKRTGKNDDKHIEGGGWCQSVWI